MKNLIRSAVVTLLAASTAQAQQAVQWRVQDGGNGHWYLPTPCTTGLDAQSRAEALRGHLVTVTTASENEFVRQLLAASGRSFAMLGLVQLDNQTSPQIGWRWATSEPVVFENWTDFDGAYGFSAPDDRPCAGGTPQEDNECNQGMMYLDGRWDDVERGRSCAGFATSSVAVVEWSADCNNDGIVDYGQCLDGTLPDTNGNNIPDCCETGEACVVGNYPVQWRVEDGGNGHWYQLRYTSDLRWETANIEAQLLGGHLATLTSPAENQRVYLVAQSPAFEGPYFGGFKNDSGECEWVTGERFVFSNWGGGEPNGGLSERFLHFKFGPVWNDVGSPYAPGYLVEWSADCNNDGIVDKGQILRGELPDVNANGIPDPCETPTCRDADLLADRNVNGIDLGILLGQWGPNTQYTISDITRDGVVDGNDLGLLLSFWGPCPY